MNAKRHWFIRHNHVDPRRIALAEVLLRRPRYASYRDTWESIARPVWDDIVHEAELPPVFEDAVEYTAFALDQFQERTERDGVSLAILTTHQLGTHGDHAFDRLHALAETRGIPVIDQYGYIVGKGGDVMDAQWAHDGHWSAAGHQWAAEALLEYLKQNQDVCDGEWSSS